MVDFPDPKPDNEKITKKNLIMTEYGTIKGIDIFDEIKINDFINKLGKKIYYCEAIYNRDNTSSIHYNTSVFKDDSNGDEYEITIDSYKYYLNINPLNKYYSVVKRNLDEFCETTKKNKYNEETINDLEGNHEIDKHNNKKDLEIYLKYLLHTKKVINKRKILNFLRYLCIPSSLILFLTTMGMNGLLFIPGIVSLTCTFGYFTLNLADYFYGIDNIFTRTKKLFKNSKLNNLKIKEISKKLKKANNIDLKINNENNMMNVPKRDAYKDAIINYMNAIMIGANKLNKSTRIVKLNELRSILDEYLERMKEFNNNKENGLTLENDEYVIVHEIIDKLTTLEMEIAELIKRDNENKKVTDDGEVLMSQINKYIESAKNETTEQEDCKKLILSQKGI